MKIIFVTHAEPEKVKPRGNFRPFTENGIQDLKLVSKEIESKDSKVTNTPMTSYGFHLSNICIATPLAA